LSFARAVPVVLLLALAAPAAAQANASLSITGSAPHKTVTFTVNDALDHSASATVSDGDLLITDSAGIAAGCTDVGANAADCGPAADFELVVFAFAGGNDGLGVPDDFPIRVSANGGPGHDILNGGVDDDELNGGPGDDVLDGRTGDDDLIGGDGADHLRGWQGADAFDGGDGADYLDTAETPAEVDAAIVCGPGSDALDADDIDDLPDDCETVEPPYLDGPLVVTGDPRVGVVLGLSLPPNVGGQGDPFFRWARCDSGGSFCAFIPGATGATYTPTTADLGSRLQAEYGVVNELGEDWIYAVVTDVVRSPSVTRPTPLPPTPRPPRPTTTRPQRPMPMPFLVIPPLAVTRKPYFVIRNGEPVVDTGREMKCPGVFGGPACHLKVAAVPTLATAHVHGRPSSLGKGSELVAATAAHARVRVPLNLRAYRLLRAKRKLTLLVTVTVTRPYSGTMQTTYTITVKMPARKRR
jgi:hypothetical protein